MQPRLIRSKLIRNIYMNQQKIQFCTLFTVGTECTWKGFYQTAWFLSLSWTMANTSSSEAQPFNRSLRNSGTFLSKPSQLNLQVRLSSESLLLCNFWSNGVVASISVTVDFVWSGLTEPRSWSEVACMVFRNHVERRALVAQLDSVEEAPDDRSAPWERKVTVYLADTSDDGDLWIHSMMSDLSSAA